MPSRSPEYMKTPGLVACCPPGLSIRHCLDEASKRGDEGRMAPFVIAGRETKPAWGDQVE
jgi:hypothetical protein